jgi:hypothetical protein
MESKQVTDKGGDAHKDEYVLTFKNGALAKLRELAKKLDVPESDLDKVVEKGLRALDLPDDDKLKFSKGGEQYFVDIKKL